MGVGQVDGAEPVDSQMCGDSLEDSLDQSVEYAGADKAIPHVEMSPRESANKTGVSEELASPSIAPTLEDADGDHQPKGEVPPTSVPTTQHVEESPGTKVGAPTHHVEGIPAPEVGAPVPSPSPCAKTPAEGMKAAAAVPVVATPCRAGAKPSLSPQFSSGEDSKDALGVSSPASSSKDPYRPVPGELRLSQNAINLRMHRAMKIDSRGNCKVGDEIRKQFHTKKGKLRLQQIFQSCGYNVDRWDVLGFGKETWGYWHKITMLIVIMNPKFTGFKDT